MSSRTSSSLESLFAPRTIAVVGASNKPGKMGNLFTQRLAAGFKGRLYAINPSEREVAGVRTHASLAELPEAMDLLIALVPAPRLLELVEACAPGQVRHLLAIPSGFGEISAEGRELEARLAVLARARGMRVVGPNCVGMLNCGLGLNASMMPVLPPGGRGLGCLTQSGGFGMALSMYALDHDVPISKFCDLGNMADLQIDEMLRYLGEDAQTAVVGLFLESVRDRGALRDALGAVARRKPVILTPVGRTPAGRRASFAHLGMEAGLSELAEAPPPGVHLAETGLDLLDAAKAMIWQPRADGRRVGIITGTGGIGAEIADLAVEHGLAVPELSPALQAALRRHLPYYAGVRNPVDLTPIWWEYPDIYPRVLRELSGSGEIDLVIVSITDVAATLPALAAAVAAASRAISVPVCVYWGARDQDRENMRIIEAARVPCCRSTRATARAAAAMAFDGARAAGVRPFDDSEPPACTANVSAA